MLFTIDLDTLELIASATDRRRVTQVECKRGDGVFFEVQFVRDGDPQELESGTVITFGAKAENKFDSGIVVLEDDFSFGGTSPKYTATPSLNTVELNELFLIDGDDENDPPFVDLMGEFTWRVGSGNTTSCRTFRVRVHNDVVRGDEFSPTPMPLPIGITAPITEETVTIGGDPTVSAVPVVFPTLYRDGDANGKPYYNNNPGGSPDYILSWYNAGPSGWLLEAGAEGGTWLAEVDVDTIDEIPAGSFVGQGAAGGTPTLTHVDVSTAPPFFRVFEGFLYFQDEDGIWVRIAHSSF